MTAIKQAHDLKQQAIDLLLNEREKIDQELQQLGHGEIKSPSKRRGRPPKISGTFDQPENFPQVSI